MALRHSPFRTYFSLLAQRGSQRRVQVAIYPGSIAAIICVSRLTLVDGCLLYFACVQLLRVVSLYRVCTYIRPLCFLPPMRA